MLHSVGCAQPNAKVFLKTWNKPNLKACVHAFIDGNNGTIYQTLPWHHRGWHSGGLANDTHIGVEICEPACIKYVGGSAFTCSDLATAQAIATRTYASAVELFAHLCKEFKLDPLADGVILSHNEGHKRGIASNHGDPEHLWQQLKLDYSMDTFRKDVWLKMNESQLDNTPAPWAKDAVDWAIEKKLIVGDERGNLLLHSYLTREQFCVLLKRYHDMMKQ